MESIGIYQIINKINNKKYIGSSIALKNRKRRHFADLKSDIHHSQALQRAYNKYGSENFDFLILEYCTQDNLLEREQYYLDCLDPEYNICKTAGNCLGVVQSEETKLKRAESLKATWKKKALGISKSKKEYIESKLRNDIIRKEKKERDAKIVEDLKSGMIQKDIAEKYDISNSVITVIKKKYNIETDNFVRRGQNNNFSKLTEKEVLEIKYMLKDKVRYKNIADVYKVKLTTIKAIASGQNWKHIIIE